MSQDRLRMVETEDPPKGAGSGGGNGSLIRYRLDELERRMEGVEGKVDQILTTCERIGARVDGLASKSHVAWIFGGTLVAVLVSLVGHLLIRVLTSTP